MLLGMMSPPKRGNEQKAIAFQLITFQIMPLSHWHQLLKPCCSKEKSVMQPIHYAIMWHSGRVKKLIRFNCCLPNFFPYLGIHFIRCQQHWFWNILSFEFWRMLKLISISQKYSTKYWWFIVFMIVFLLCYSLFVGNYSMITAQSITY